MSKTKEQEEALSSAGLNPMMARLFMGVIRILMKKAGPALLKNGKSGISMIGFVNPDGKLSVGLNLHNLDGTKTKIEVGSEDIDEAEEEAIQQLSDKV